MYGANRDPTFCLLSRNVVLRAVGKESRDAGIFPARDLNHPIAIEKRLCQKGHKTGEEPLAKNLSIGYLTEIRTSKIMRGSNKLQSVATEASPLLSYDSGDSDAQRYTRVEEAAKKCLLTHVPITSWLPKYTFNSLLRDVIAGLTVGLMVVPQGLAYATIAKLPVQYGLYSAYLGCFVYCVFGGSKDVTLGPTAIMSLLVARYADGCVPLAVAMTLFCGIIQFTLGLLRLGFVVRFISLPVISGFVSAAAITIGFGQVKNLLGLKNIDRAFISCVYQTFENIGKTKLWDLLLGSCCIVLLVILKKLNRIKWHEDKDDTTLQRVCRKFLWVVSTGRNALVVLLAAAVAKAVESAGHKDVFTMTDKAQPGIPHFKVGVYKLWEQLQNTRPPRGVTM